MADPNMPPLPPGFTLDAPQQSAPVAFGGRPVIEQGPPVPTPQTPLQQENTRTNIAQGQTSIANTKVDNIRQMRQEFQKQQPFQDFVTVLPMLGSAMQAGPNKAGDLNLVYAFGKAMDPGSVVREGEQVMATNVGGVSEKVKGYLDSIAGAGQLTPQQRLELVQEIRLRARALNDQYNQLRDYYVNLSKQNGFDPEQVVGLHPAQPFLATEAEWYKRAAAQQAGQQQPEQQTIPIGAGEFGGRKDIPPLDPKQQAAFDAWWAAHPDPSADDLRAFGQSMGVQINNADEIIKAKRAGVGVAPASAAVLDPPNISDVRGGQNTPTQDAFNAGVRGLADTVSLGTADKLIAGADTLFKGGTMDQNLARQYAISDFDAQNHPIARGVGQIGGGVLLPMGEVNSLGNLALKGARYGTAYGAGSSRSLSDVPMNALLGGAAGATTAAAIGLGGKAIGLGGKAIGALRRGPAEVPPLVDPQTGELNPVLDSVSAAQRVQMMRDQGFNPVTPGMAGGRTARVIEQGFNNAPGSAGVMEDVNSTVSGQARKAMQNVAQQFGSSKTLNEGGSELQRGAQEWMNRFDQVTSKAYSSIPISPKAPTNLNNTVATLQRLSSKIESNPELAQEVADPTMAKYLDAINKNGLSWQDLKDFRTFVGNKVGQFRFSEDARTSDYRALYAALSEDMRNSAAAQGLEALRAFERANTIYQQGQQRIEGALTRILGKDAMGSPERAAAAVQAMTRGGKATGDLRTLAQIRASTVKSGAWDEVASTLIHLGGQPANSEGRAFNPQTFVNWYADMAEPARAMLFKPDLRQALDKFVATSQQIARVKGLTNSSNTTPTMIGSGFVTAIGGSAAVGFLNPMAWLGTAAMVAGAGLNNVMARAWTSAKFVNLLTGAARAAASGNENAVRSQIGRMQKLATTNPELRAGIEHVLRSIANDNAPMAGQIAASPNQGPEQQGQPQQ